MATELEWDPRRTPSTSPIVFTTGADAQYRLIRPDGLDPVNASPITSKGPGQAGETALDVVVGPRVTGVAALIQSADADALWTSRRELGRAFAQQPVRLGGEIVLGLLTLRRDGLDDRVIDAMPRSLTVTKLKSGPYLAVLDAEWLCPYPFWRDADDSEVASIANDDSELAVNDGDVDAPIVAQLWGPATAVRLTNSTTGEVVEVTATLTATTYIEIDTTPGIKSIELVDSVSGDRDNAMSGLVLASARLWSLRPGNNSILYHADGSGVGTHARVVWQNRYADIG